MQIHIGTRKITSPYMEVIKIKEMTITAELLLSGNCNKWRLPSAANKHETTDRSYMTAAYGSSLQLHMHAKLHIHAHA